MLEESGVHRGGGIVPSKKLSILMLVLISALLPACSPAAVTPSTPATDSGEATASRSENLTSSDALTRDCRHGQGFSGVGVGEMAVDFTLKDTYGSEYSLSALLVEKPVVMVFGSFT
jgi:cytochrome oxidase Cu insertion factor (SCO1/SenC/PrrC family)